MQANKTAFVSALNSYVTTVTNATKTFRQAAIDAGYNTWEAAQPVVIEWVGKRHGVAVVVSQSPRNKGELTLDRSAANFEAAKTTLRRIREALTGDADEARATSEKAELEVPAHIAKLAAQLAAACSEYEGARKLGSTALAQAFAAK